jgi:hypothetical protein
MKMDATARQKMADLLGVDEIEVASGLAGYTVRMRFSGEYLSTIVDVRTPSEEVCRRLFDLSKQLRERILRQQGLMGYQKFIDQTQQAAAAIYGMPADLLNKLDMSTATGTDLDRAAALAGIPMTREQALRLAAENDFRCAARDCGHPSNMHGRDRDHACAIWGCECPCYITPTQRPLKTTEPARPMNRFEAIAEELKKL